LSESRNFSVEVRSQAGWEKQSLDSRSLQTEKGLYTNRLTVESAIPVAMEIGWEKVEDQFVGRVESSREARCYHWKELEREMVLVLASLSVELYHRLLREKRFLRLSRSVLPRVAWGRLLRPYLCPHLLWHEMAVRLPSER
jgi:hypothetical protein